MRRLDHEKGLHEFELKNADAIYITLSFIQSTLRENRECDAKEVLDNLEGFLERRKKKLQWYVDVSTIHLALKIEDFRNGQRNTKS